jgi:hypothetical protein
MNPAEIRRAEERFAEVFAHLGAVTAYARRRGAVDPEEIAAEVMAIAWRKLSDVPQHVACRPPAPLAPAALNR